MEVSIEEILQDPSNARIPTEEKSLLETLAKAEIHLRKNPDSWKKFAIYSIRLPDVGIVLAKICNEIIINMDVEKRNEALKSLEEKLMLNKFMPISKNKDKMDKILEKINNFKESYNVKPSIG